MPTQSGAPDPAAAGPARTGVGGGNSAGGARGTFAARSVRNFRRYISGQALSPVGTWVETVAQALLVLRLTDSGVILGLSTAARIAPVLLLSPYAGLRSSGSQATHTADHPDRARPGLTRARDPGPERAVTLNSTAVNVARVIGPSVAAVLAAAVGLGWCFIANAVSFCSVIASLLLLDGRQLRPVAPVRRAARDTLSRFSQDRWSRKRQC